MKDKPTTEGNFTFEVGDKVLDFFNNEMEILAKALRPSDYKYREQYLCRRKIPFGHKDEWLLQTSLTKIL